MISELFSPQKIFYKATGIPAYKIKQMIENHSRNLVDFLRYRQWPMFRAIVIETSSYCNRRCKDCPNSISPRGKEYLGNEIFEAIVAELSKLNFSGSVHLHAFNEPLTDPDIVKRVRFVSENVPKACVKMNSNGDYLTLNLLKDLVSAGLNGLFVTQYDGKVHEHIKKIQKEANDQEKRVLSVRCQSDFIGNRGGILSSPTQSLLADCYRPSNQLVVNYKGEIQICCNDYYGKIILGKAGQTSLMDIWSGKKFINIRRRLKNKERFKIETCKGCNFLGDIYNSRDLMPEEIVKINRGEKLKSSTPLAPVDN